MVVTLGELVMILDLHRQGLSASAIAKRTGLDRKTVRRYVERGLEPPTYGPRPPRETKVTRFERYLRGRVGTFPELTAIRLLREIRELGYAVKELADRHGAAAVRAAQHVTAYLRASAATPSSPVPTPVPPKPTGEELASAAARVRRQSRYEEAARLRAAGASIKRIAAELGTERKTVRRWLRLGRAPLWKQPSGDSILDPFVNFLTRRWDEGCRNAAQLWRELVQLGFRGRPTTVRHWLGMRRRHSAEQGGSPAGSLPPVWPVPRGYRLARLLMADTSKLNAEDALFKTRLLDDEPALNADFAWAKRLNALLQRKKAGDLHEILTAAAGTMLARFAASLRRDFEAINAALELPWITSPVEGQISRLKMLKRTMYGRAGFELLRARVFHAA